MSEIVYFSLIITFLLVLGLIVAAVQNSTPVEFKFFTWKCQISLLARTDQSYCLRLSPILPAICAIIAESLGPKPADVPLEPPLCLPFHSRDNRPYEERSV